MARHPVQTGSQPQAIRDTALQSLVGYRVKRASNAIQADLVDALAPFELRMITFTALTLVVENPGLSQSQLAAAMDIERPNLVVIVDELETRELISRDRVPTDRRTYALHATLAGRRLQENAMKAVRAHEARMLAGIDARTLDALTTALGKIARNRGRDE